MNENYIVITESMLQLGLKPIEVMLLAKIKSYKNGCFASIENISKELNVGYSTIQRALKTLLNKGLIIADKKTKYNTIKYTVVETLTGKTPTENNQENNQENKQDNKQENNQENNQDNKQDEQKEENTPKEEKAENKENTSYSDNINNKYTSGYVDSLLPSWAYGEYDYN